MTNEHAFFNYSICPSCRNIPFHTNWRSNGAFNPNHSFNCCCGVYFVRLQGLSTLKSGVAQLYKNQIPVYEMISGAALALAALLLIIPGFATDIIGFLLILPITRNIIFKYLGKKYTKEKIKDDLIEGEYEDKDN